MKTECIRKSLTSDFKNVGIYIGIILGIIIGSYIFLNAIVYLITAIKSIEFAIGAYEAFIILGIFTIVLGFAINLLDNKERLVKDGTFESYCNGTMLTLVLYIVYCIISECQYISYDTPHYPDVNLIFVIFIFAGIVLTPFALAYVRCKEEVGVK